MLETLHLEPDTTYFCLTRHINTVYPSSCQSTVKLAKAAHTSVIRVYIWALDPTTNTDNKKGFFL